MAGFTAEVFQNEFLAEGATDVHAIVRITATGAGTAQAGAPEAAEVIMIDTSGSMAGASFAAAQQAAQVALDVIDDGTWFAIVGGSHVANRVFPYPNAPSATVRMEPAARAEATYAPDSHVMLTDKLITTATLEFRLQGVSRVTVPARAVVTPAARDLLKERSIELVRS